MRFSMLRGGAQLGVLLISAAGILDCSRLAPPRAIAPVPAALARQPSLLEGQPERGRELYESRCFACHSIDANRVGPMHKNLFGRTAGSVESFDYSPAVRASEIVWNEATLNAWLTNPEDLIPGQKMSYSVPDAQDRADIIAYLRDATRQ